MRINHISAVALMALLAACNNNKTEAPKATTPPASMQAPKSAATDSLKKLAFDSKKDLVCGMPVHAGITDTLTYKGKLYGFCSPECKADFVKSPEQYLAEAK